MWSTGSSPLLRGPMYRQCKFCLSLPLEVAPPPFPPFLVLTPSTLVCLGE